MPPFAADGNQATAEDEPSCSPAGAPLVAADWGSGTGASVCSDQAALPWRWNAGTRISRVPGIKQGSQALLPSFLRHLLCNAPHFRCMHHIKKHAFCKTQYGWWCTLSVWCDAAYLVKHHVHPPSVEHTW